MFEVFTDKNLESDAKAASGTGSRPRRGWNAAPPRSTNSIRGRSELLRTRGMAFRGMAFIRALAFGRAARALERSGRGRMRPGRRPR